MRPAILFPLFAPVTAIPGVGPRLGKLIEKAAGPRLTDVLWSLPQGFVDWRAVKAIREAEPGERAMLRVRIVEHVVPRSQKQPYKIRASDETSFIDLTFFRPKGDYLDKTFPPGEVRYVGGKVERYQDRPVMAHPERVATEEEFARTVMIDVVYPLTEGLPAKVMAKAAAHAAGAAPVLPEWQDAAWLARNQWPSWREALTSAHHPRGPEDLNPDSPARRRLAYDEVLANQLALTLVRERTKAVASRALRPDPALAATARAALPFALTPGQDGALSDILADLASGRRVLRLLQGDVGSGKTAVAFLAMTAAWSAGAQTALMAPTEVLARQHSATLSGWAEKSGIEAALLTGREKGETRSRIVDGLREGRIQALVGTHALLTEDVVFRDLALAVVDEQHRFGVRQRLTLSAKGRTPPHLIVMTATPIPRSLALAHYGDMDMTRILGKPPGRRDVETKALPMERIEDVTAAVSRALSRGERVYWVCPLIEETEEGDDAAAELRFADLSARFGAKTGLLHGRLKPAEKDAAIAAFKSGAVQVLVATTVIEVGVDVPSATLMVVEHAERFGLAQLHQLRGRVGRGDKASVCVLLYQSPLGPTARARLNCLRRTGDGFEIAEEDLRLRGAGELLGQRQSGLEAFRLAAIDRHADLIQAAHDDARLIVARDPELKSPRGEALRVLLYLFERDEAVRTLRAG